MTSQVWLCENEFDPDRDLFCRIILESAHMSNMIIDPVHKLLFYTHKIKRAASVPYYSTIHVASLDGTNSRQIYQVSDPRTGFVTGLNLDQAAEEIFWIERQSRQEQQKIVLKRMSYMGEILSEVSLTGLGNVPIGSGNSLIKVSVRKLKKLKIDC